MYKQINKFNSIEKINSVLHIFALYLPTTPSSLLNLQSNVNIAGKKKLFYYMNLFRMRGFKHSCAN